jgi:hypothetical protein
MTTSISLKPTVSLAIADTDAYILAKTAVKLSLQKFAFDDILIFSDNQAMWHGFNIVQIEKITSIEEYNLLITQELAKHLKTDFCVVIQYDGFIIGKEQFSNAYFDVDYIGAPWSQHTSYQVGNGGFSWRSKKLINAVAQLSLDLSKPEDDQICRIYRPLLEHQFNCKFANYELASQFSREYGEHDYPTFGFHGLANMPYVYKENLDFLFANLPDRVIKNELKMLEIIHSLKKISASKYKI